VSDRTAVYRLFDADDVLLYIGISKNFGQRWHQHAATQPWWPEVQRQAIEWHPGRPQALAAETSAIREERPRYNVVHGERAPRGTAERIAALSAPGPGGPLRALALAYNQAVAEREESQRVLAAAIWEAADGHMPQVEIVQCTGLTRERIRQLCLPEYRARALERRKQEQ
jgi:predicted GIY-YIG superfamily endonuclease